MSERLRVPDDIAVRINHEAMRETVESMFCQLGSPDADARRCADSLLYADLRGIDSHGVSNMMPIYVAGLRSGDINPAPRMKIVRDAPGVATADSDRGLGLTIGPLAMELAMDKAAACGIGAVSVTNGGHFGAAAVHAHQALSRDMIGVAMTVGGLYMPPTFGSKPMLGVNPIAVAAPARNEPPFVFDASTSSVAANKIILARRLGVDIPGGWIATTDGTPVMEEGPVPDDFLLLPVGGTHELGSHKAYSHSVAADILCGLLAGSGPAFLRRAGVSHHFLAYRIDAFVDPDLFKNDLDTYLSALRTCPTAPGHERVVYAGLPEHEIEQDRRARGIPYHPRVVDWFRKTAAELGIEQRLG